MPLSLFLVRNNSIAEILCIRWGYHLSGLLIVSVVLVSLLGFRCKGIARSIGKHIDEVAMEWFQSHVVLECTFCFAVLTSGGGSVVGCIPCAGSISSVGWVGAQLVVPLYTLCLDTCVVDTLIIHFLLIKLTGILIVDEFDETQFIGIGCWCIIL